MIAIVTQAKLVRCELSDSRIAFANMHIYVTEIVYKVIFDKLCIGAKGSSNLGKKVKFSTKN